MKLGVFTTVLRNEPLEAVVSRLAALGVEAIELGTGNWPGDQHCDLDGLLANAQARRDFLQLVGDHGLTISALSQHGNPVHPDPAVAAHDHDVFVKTVRLAAELGVPVVNGFSGCPGDGPAATGPNWVTCGWPPEFRAISQWQWDERLVPYWQEQIRLLERHGVVVGIEMHPGFCVYNAATMLRLRAATGDAIGTNFDPSHLFWQGVDPVVAIQALAGAIHHVHAKDTYLDAANIAVNGVLDLQPPGHLAQRPWYFRSVGLGQPPEAWRDIIAALRGVGYDGAVSIEHEDPLMEIDEGLEAAIRTLRAIIPSGE